MGNWFTRLIAVGIFIGGGIALYYGIENLNNANASEKWPSVQGKIDNVDVKETRGSKGRRNYKPIIHYSYFVGNQEYKGDRISFGDHSSSSRTSAEDIAKKYRAIHNLEVFYSPDDPTNCVLEPGATFYVYMLPGIGGLMLLLGGFLTFSMIFSGGEEDQSETEAKVQAPSSNVNSQDSFDFGPPRT